MKKLYVFVLTFFCGITSSFSCDSQTTAANCRKAGCYFTFNDPYHATDRTGVCSEFVISDCASHTNAADCYRDPQCNFDDKKTCVTNPSCTTWGNAKDCNAHNDTNGTPCQPPKKNRCDRNTGGAAPNLPAKYR